MLKFFIIDKLLHGIFLIFLIKLIFYFNQNIKIENLLKMLSSDLTRPGSLSSVALSRLVAWFSGPDHACS